MKSFSHTKALLLAAIITSFLYPNESTGAQRSEILRRSQEQSLVHRNILMGKKLSANAVADLEYKLLQSPNNLQLRTQLIAYYGDVRHWENAPRRKKFQHHVLWLITTRPEAAVLRSPSAQLNPHFDGDAYLQAKKAWIRNVQKQPTNIPLLGNAIEQLGMSDRRIAIEITKKAATLQPRESLWPQKLGEFYKRDMLKRGAPTRELAAKSAAAFEQAHSRAIYPNQKAYHLQSLAITTFAAQQYEAAKEHATKLVKIKKHLRFAARSHHVGHTILGRLAAKDGEIDTAIDHLLDSVISDTASKLNSTGILMSLAQDLLEHEEWDVVTEYLQICSKSWQSPRDLKKLAEWQTQIASKQIPTFGAHRLQ